jgi:hypothetical protein
MFEPGIRKISVLHTPKEVKNALYNACRNSGFTLTRKSGEGHHYKLSAYHQLYGFYYFDLSIEAVDELESSVVISREGGKSLFFDPIKLAEKFLDFVEADLNKYTY